MKKTVNIIACGALANELVALKSLNDWQHFNIDCVPAKYHSTPHLITDAVRDKITNIRKQNDGEILIAYGECGTQGELDKLIEETNTMRLPGAQVAINFSLASKNLKTCMKLRLVLFILPIFLLNTLKRMSGKCWDWIVSPSC